MRSATHAVPLLLRASRADAMASAAPGTLQVVEGQHRLDHDVGVAIVRRDAR